MESKHWSPTSRLSKYYTGGDVGLFTKELQSSNNEITLKHTLVTRCEDDVAIVDLTSGRRIASLQGHQPLELRKRITAFVIVNKPLVRDREQQLEIVTANERALTLSHYRFDGAANETTGSVLPSATNINDEMKGEESDPFDKTSKNENENEVTFTHITSFSAVHRLPVLLLASDPSGTLIASGSSDGTAKVFDLEHGYCTHNFKSDMKGGIVTLLYFHPNPRALQLICSAEGPHCNGHVFIYDLRTSTKIATLQEHLSAVTSCQVLGLGSIPSMNNNLPAGNNGSVLVTAGRDRILSFWDIGPLLQTQEALQNQSIDENVEYNQRSGLSNSRGKKKRKQQVLQKRNLGGGAAAVHGTSAILLKSIMAHENVESLICLGGKSSSSIETTGMPTSVNHQYKLYSAGDSGKLHEWNVKFQVKPDGIGFDRNTRKRSRRRQSTGEFINTSTSANLMKCPFIVSPGSFSCSCVGRKKILSDSIVFTNLLGFGHLEKKVLIGVTSEHNFICFEGKVESSEYKEDNNDVQKNINDDVQKKINDDEQKKGKTDISLQKVKTLVGYNAEIIQLKLEKNFLAMATNSSEARFYNVKNWSAELLVGHSNIITSIDMRLLHEDDSALIVTSSRDFTIRLWRVDSLSSVPNVTCLGIGRGHTESVTSVTFSNLMINGNIDKLFCISGAEDSTIKVWDVNAILSNTSTGISSHTTLQSLPTLCGLVAHKKTINAIRVSPDNQLCASASQDKTIKLWNLEYHQKSKKRQTASAVILSSATLSGHRRGVWGLEFSPIARLLASCSGDAMIRIWSLDTYLCVRTLQGHQAPVLQCGFLKGGKQIISSDAAGLLKLWSLQTSECINTFTGHTELDSGEEQDGILGMAVSSSGTNDKGKRLSGNKKRNDTDDSLISMFDDQIPDCKLWALSIDGNNLVTGGTDSQVVKWLDVTSDIKDRVDLELKEKLEAQQALDNLVFQGKFIRAFQKALHMEYPRKLLRIIMAFVCHRRNKLHQQKNSFEDKQLQENGKIEENEFSQDFGDDISLLKSSIEILVSAVLNNQISDDKEDDQNESFQEEEDTQYRAEYIVRLLRYAKTWNTNAKTSQIANSVLNALLNECSLQELAGDQEIANTNNLQGVVQAVTSYNTRHIRRLQTLLESTFLCDYVLASGNLAYAKQAISGKHLMEIRDEDENPEDSENEDEMEISSDEESSDDEEVSLEDNVLPKEINRDENKDERDHQAKLSVDTLMKEFTRAQMIKKLTSEGFAENGYKNWRKAVLAEALFKLLS
eukprot:g1460.t1